MATYVVMIPAGTMMPEVYGVFRSTATAEHAAAQWNARQPVGAQTAIVVPVQPAADLARRDPAPPAGPSGLSGLEPGWSRRLRRGQGRGRPPAGPSPDGPPPGPRTVL